MAGPQRIANEPYETDFHKLGGGLSAPFRGIAGLAGNVLTRAGLTNTSIQARDLATREPASGRPSGIAPLPVAGTTSPVSRGTSPVSSPRPTTTPPRPAAARPIAGPTEPPTRYENMGLGPNDLSRTSTGRVPTPAKPVGIADGAGSGYAVVGGKRINYQDIGTKRDPLAQRRDGFVSTPEGTTMLLGNPSAYRPIPREDKLGGRGIADLTPQETITRNNERIQSDLATITANMGNMYDGDQQIAAAKMRIAALQGQNDLLQKGIAGDQALEGHKYAADAGLAAHRIAGDAQIAAARLGAEATSDTALAKLLREQQERQSADTQDERKRRDGLVRSYLDRYDWGKISPTAANEYAGLLADTDGKGYVTLRDPSGTYGDVLVHQGVEQALRSAYGKIKTSDQFQAYLNQARKLGAGKAPVYQTKIKNTANLSLLRSKQDLLPEAQTNG